MNRSWRDVVAELGGPDAAMRVMDGTEWDANVVAELVVPGGLFRSRGDDEDEAWGGVAHRLGDLRLMRSLEAAGWTDLDEVIDETTYVVGRDPDGKLWAIGVAGATSDRRRYIETDIEYDDRTFDRVAFVGPIDTRDWASLERALEAST